MIGLVLVAPPADRFLANERVSVPLCGCGGPSCNVLRLSGRFIRYQMIGGKELALVVKDGLKEFWYNPSQVDRA